MSRTFVIGDIHGAYRALKQCLERARFDYQKDQLICLGDVADGWPETRRCIDELLKIKNLIYILGNHDFWTLEWMENNKIDTVWYDQGGKATIESYSDTVPKSHLEFLQQARPYYILNDRLFVHAGIDPQTDIAKQTIQTFLWSRDLAKLAYHSFMTNSSQILTPYAEVYIGHTPVSFPYPIKGSEVWMMDTGAGWSGVLTIMNIETKQFVVSDEVPALYPGVEGRRRV